MPNILRPYQSDLVSKIASLLHMDKKVCAQLNTGGGKTVIFSSICNRYISKSEKDILILVHRKELLEQACSTLYDWHGIIAEKIVPKNKKPAPNRVYVGMIETANNRLKLNPYYFNNVGLLIIDEAHGGQFKKIFEYFRDTLTIGFTATPISAVKKHPLRDIYKSIAVGPDVTELIAMKALVPCLTYAPKNVNRKDLHSGAGPDGFDLAEMASVYSNTRHVQNTVEKYKAHALGKKTLVFNCNVAHSKLVCEAFVNAGYNARHLDGEDESEERTDTLRWFKETPDAILCSVAVLTTGFDEPSVQCVIVNKSTKSLALWLQMCGRGGRPFPGKDFFIIVDMGDNVTWHLEWSSPRNWEFIFNNPDKPIPKESGVAGIKICVNASCEHIIPIQAVMCKYCGALQPIPEPSYDQKLGDFVLVTKNIDVAAMIRANEGRVKNDGSPVNPYNVLHTIKEQVINTYAASFKGRKIDDLAALKILEAYQLRVADWCKETGKKYNAFHRTATAEWMQKALFEKYLWKPEELSLEISDL